ncbi:MAG: M23 family metallopeptidase [Saprospiraceae bacterium]|nr:M23 family metallopeptidase [Saprospiraceae bacterium]
MRYFLVIIYLSIGFSLASQEEVKIYSERQGGDVFIFADNPALIPMTIDLKLNLTNMDTDFGGNKGMFVIPPQAERFEITKATPNVQQGRTGLSLESFIYTGDVKSEHDNDYLYQLPFEKGATYIVSQGYNGKFSHQGENAIDFALEVGEKVYAARGGIVYKTVKKNKKSCRNSSCQQYNNFITIYHEDGTFSEYSHLTYNGVSVKAGDKVKAGELIGYSGNTGWSSGPHLHFVVYRYNKKGERITLKTKFETKKKKGIYLKENKSYSK